jgi:hypothetical protein
MLTGSVVFVMNHAIPGSVFFKYEPYSWVRSFCYEPCYLGPYFLNMNHIAGSVVFVMNDATWVRIFLNMNHIPVAGLVVLIMNHASWAEIYT